MIVLLTGVKDADILRETTVPILDDGKMKRLENLQLLFRVACAITKKTSDTVRTYVRVWDSQQSLIFLHIEAFLAGCGIRDISMNKKKLAAVQQSNFGRKLCRA